MATQKRMVHARLLSSHRLNSRSVKHRYLYIGTILIADDDGRLNVDPRYLKGQIFSYDDDVSIEDVRKIVEELAEDGQLTIYEVSGSTYAEHPKWSEWQKIRTDMYVPSKVPSPKQARIESVTEALQESTLSKVKLNQTKLSESNGPTPGELTTKFFEMVNLKGIEFDEFIEKLVAKGFPSEIVKIELVKFTSYWTELNSTGRQQRWQKEKTFEVQKRLNTWFSRAGKWSSGIKQGVKVDMV